MTEITYTLYICDLCGGKQADELSELKLNTFGEVTHHQTMINKKICKHCDIELTGIIKRMIKQN